VSTERPAGPPPLLRGLPPPAPAPETTEAGGLSKSRLTFKATPAKDSAMSLTPPAAPAHETRSTMTLQSKPEPAGFGARELTPELLETIEKTRARAEKVKAKASRLTRNPWSAYAFLFRFGTIMSIVLMMVVFTGFDLLAEMAVGSNEADDAKAAAAAEQKKAETGKPAKAEPAARDKSAKPAPPPEPKGEIRLEKSGKGKEPVKVTASDLSPGQPVIAFKPPPEKEKRPGSSAKEYAELVAAESGEAGVGDLDDAIQQMLEEHERDPVGNAMGGGSPMGMLGMGLLGIKVAAVKLVLLMYFAALMLTIIHETAGGLETMPRWPNPTDMVDSFFVPAFHFSSAFILCFVPAMVALVWAMVFKDSPEWVSLTGYVLMGVGCLYFPMALMCVAVRGSVSSILPGYVFPAIGKSGIHYLPALLAFLLSQGVGALRTQFLELHMPHFPAVLIETFLSFALMVVCMRSLGILYRRVEDDLGWFNFGTPAAR
jgi:hypothetical protein